MDEALKCPKCNAVLGVYDGKFHFKKGKLSFSIAGNLDLFSFTCGHCAKSGSIKLEPGPNRQII